MTTSRRGRFKPAKAAPEKKGIRYHRRITRVVDGAIADTMIKHPAYFRDAAAARRSLVKRIVGNITSFLAQARQSRPGRKRRIIG